MNTNELKTKVYPHALKADTVVGGKYVVKEVIGQGGFGITYLVQDYQTKELVALKEYFPEMLASRTEDNTVCSFAGNKEQNYVYGKQCFLQEAKTLAEFIGNNNIVRIINYFEDYNTAYFAMEYVEGLSLKSYTEQNGGKLSWEETRRILFPVMDALTAIHSKGIIHRDVSPDNIIITHSGEIKLIDFGAARYSLGDKSRSLDVVLKHGYAPKEQYTRHGKQGPFTDIYSLGATFYRTLTGRVPPDSIDRLEEDDLILPSTLKSDIPEHAENAIVKALSVQPADRFQSVAEFKAALQDDAAPVQGETFAYRQNTAMVQQNTATVQQNTATVQQNIATVQQNIATVQQNTAAAEKEATAPAPKANNKNPYIIAASVVAAILVVVGLISFFTRPQTTLISENAEPPYENGYPIKIGVVKDNTYINEYFSLEYSVPQDQSFFTKEELFEDAEEDEKYTFEDRYALTVGYFWGAYTDSISRNNQGLYIHTFAYDKDRDTEYNYPDCESVLKSIYNLDVYQSNDDLSDFSVSDVKIAGMDFKALEIYDLFRYDNYYVTEKDGNYFLIEIVFNPGDTNSEEVLSWFQPLK